jgi:hypothetical protein
MREQRKKMKLQILHRKTYIKFWKMYKEWISKKNGQFLKRRLCREIILYFPATRHIMA